MALHRWKCSCPSPARPSASTLNGTLWARQYACQPLKVRKCVPASLNTTCEFSASFRARDTRTGANVFPRRVLPMADAGLPTTRVSLLTLLRQDPSDQAGWDEFVE